MRSAPTARVAANTCSQVHLPVYGVVKARSISAPRSASARWSSAEIALRGELRMGDDDRTDPRRDGRVDDGEDLVCDEMPGGEHEVVVGDDLQHLVEGRQRPAGVVEHGHRPWPDPGGGAKLELEANPHRDLAVRIGRLHLG